MIEKKDDLGRHCYSKVASMVGEFYGFDFDNCDCPAAPEFTDVNGGARIDEQMFVQKLSGLFSGSLAENEAYNSYLKALFHMGTSMMIEDKTDIGEHCYEESSSLVSQFYGFPSCHDSVLSARCVTPPDFADVNGNDRIDRSAFVAALSPLYTSSVPKEKQAWLDYLDALFDSGLSMMIEKKDDLGRHCYSKVASMVGEFYGFDFDNCAQDQCPPNSYPYDLFCYCNDSGFVTVDGSNCMSDDEESMGQFVNDKFSMGDMQWPSSAEESVSQFSMGDMQWPTSHKKYKAEESVSHLSTGDLQLPTFDTNSRSEDYENNQ